MGTCTQKHTRTAHKDKQCTGTQTHLIAVVASLVVGEEMLQQPDSPLPCARVIDALLLHRLDQLAREVLDALGGDRTAQRTRRLVQRVPAGAAVGIVGDRFGVQNPELRHLI